MTLWQDLKHGYRMLVKTPGFTAIAVVSIAIGVGANAAMFSVADGLVFRPLPVPSAGDVVTVSARAQNAAFGGRRLSYPDYVDLRDRSSRITDLVAYQIIITSYADRADQPAQRKVGMAASGNLFDAMRVRPAMGRPFRADEDRVPGRDAVVVLDYDEWVLQFGSDPNIIDRRLRIGGVDFTVVGVAPRGFTGIDHDVHPAFYVPLAMYTAVQNGAQPDVFTRRDSRVFVVKGRLAPDATMNDARQEAQQLATSLAQTYPDSNHGRDFLVQTQFEAYRDLPGGGDTNLVVMLMSLAFVVLAIACANVAGLLMSRAPVRAREVALRMAVGARRGRLVRQLMTESLMMATAGAVLGLGLAYAIIMAFRTVEYPTDIPLKLTFELDDRAVTVAMLVAVASAILSGLIPAWRASRTDLVSSLKDAAALPGAFRSRLWGRSVVVCGQVALSLLLLTITVFIYRSFQSQLEQGPGFRTNGMLFASFDPGLARYDEARTRTFFTRLRERAATLPGVRSVSLASTVPMRTDNLQVTTIAPEGFVFAPGVESINCPTVHVDEGYFETTGIRIIEGRAFLTTDTDTSPPVAIVNQRFAQQYWPGQSAIGKRLEIRGNRARSAEVVGVAADSKYFFIAEPPREFMYLPHAQTAMTRRSLMLVSTDSALALADPLRELVRSMDPEMPVMGLRTMEDYYQSRVINISRLLVGTVGGMGTTGVLLAVVGLYGLMAYSVSRRTREIGIRIAVGAAPQSVLRMVMRHGLILATVGIAIGVAGSIPVDGLLQGVFQNSVGPRGGFDALTYALVVPALVAVTLLAAYLPARRAARTDPLRALRQD